MKGHDTVRLAGVLAQCPALAHLGLCDTYIFGAAGAERLARVLGKPSQSFPTKIPMGIAQRWLTSVSAGIRSDQPGQRVLQECWGSAQRWRTSISASISSDQPGQRGLQECWHSVQLRLTLISATIGLKQQGQRALQECWRSAQHWLIFCRHLALLALCHLSSRQSTRKSDIVYTYSMVAFGLTLSF